MKNILNYLFPLLDHLYIYQLLEYEPWDFLRWFFKYPFKRNLQRKHKLEWTKKALILGILSFLLIIFLSFIATISQVFSNLYFYPLFLLLYAFFSPFFIIFAHLIFWPLEKYQKNKLINQAREKIKDLPNLKVVAIVGSFAKTSTKNMLYTLLWKDFRVVKTPKSFNTEVSIARTILADLKENTGIFLVEMDAYHKGEIKKLCQIVNPDLGIITGIAAQHLERFGSMENLAKTQFELAQSIKKDGVLFLNAHSEWIKNLEGEFTDVKKVFYGQDDVKNVEQNARGISFKLSVDDEQLKINLPVFGGHNAINFAGASAIAHYLGLSFKKIQERARLILPTEHRLEIKKTGNITMIDNTYNTNPIASASSLKLLNGYAQNQEKIVLTPGLVELGDQSAKENIEFGKSIAKVANKVIIVGENAKQALSKGLKDANFSLDNIYFVNTTNEGLELINKIAKKGAVVLLENDLPDQYF